MKRLSREEKEQIYRRKMTELQTMWGNPIAKNDFDNLQEIPDARLDELIADVVHSIRFEKAWNFMATAIKFAAFTFVALGIVGLLLFFAICLVVAFISGTGSSEQPDYSYCNQYECW